jgi:predicted RNase H-like nuclease
MTAVLGIDAAWTARNDSGYALVEKIGGAWRLKVAASDIRAFSRKCGGVCEDEGLSEALHCAKRSLGGRKPDLIAVDMPMSRTEIIGRRVSDIGVSKRFGAAKCATHSPSAERPGKISGSFRAACEAEGYELIAAEGSLPSLSLAEIYPHPALLALLDAKARIPYKVGKTKTYWPRAAAEMRRESVLASLRNIIRALDEVIVGVSGCVAPLLTGAKGFAGLKPAEDMIDAIVSAWVGMMILEGRAEAIGDKDSAIWIPRPMGPMAALAGVA